MPTRYQQDEEKSLDSVQRWVVSALLIVVGGAPTATLAAYAPVLGRTDRSSAIVLLVVCVALGLLTVAGVLVIHRKSPLTFLLALGLVPALVSAYFLF